MPSGAILSYVRNSALLTVSPTLGLLSRLCHVDEAQQNAWHEGHESREVKQKIRVCENIDDILGTYEMIEVEN